ncbi:MAG: prolyl oligopeptidase family serine peptidase [Verrucomicrobiales bacterium]
MAEFKSADATRVYVGGFSMGGYGTWDLVARHPELFAAAVPVCGGAAPGRAKAIAEAGVKVWAFHGADDGVVPPAGTQAMVKALKEAGAAVEYTEFPKTGHNAWTPAWQKPEVLGWVFAQKRDAAPR